MEGDDRDPSVYDNLRDQVSSTLKGTLLLEATTRHEQQLEAEVARRTEELRRANRDLTAEIAQRRVLEREVQEISDRTMRSIGQDLHDDLCQRIAGIGLFAALLENRLKEAGEGGDSPAAAAGRVRALLEEAVTRTRQIARGLYPPGLVERGLSAAVEDIADSLGRSAGVRVNLQVEEDFAWLPPALSLQVFRIVQESLNNAIRHSGSELVMLRLFRQNGQAVAEVRDFGRGMAAAGGTPGGNGMGLRIMRYRAESIGAELSVNQLDPGVCVACRLPLHG
jgi:signal transduction histidine kinase